RAKEELYLCHARLREFRGSTLYAVPSMFLDELPEGVQTLDLSASGAGTAAAIEHWRGGSAAANLGWSAAGETARPDPIAPATVEGPGFAEGMLVRHPTYGTGRVTEISGHGVTRRVRVRFATAGERTFAGQKVALEIVRKS